jgi:hypothetical protein
MNMMEIDLGDGTNAGASFEYQPVNPCAGSYTLALAHKSRYHGPRMDSPGTKHLRLCEHAALYGAPGECRAFLK